jgi:hypothetical protein
MFKRGTVVEEVFVMRTSPRPAIAVAALAMLAPCAVALVAAGSPASASPGPGQDQDGWHGGGAALTARTILAGSSLTHAFTVAGSSTVRTEPLSSPDDITRLGRDIFVGFQNGVGPQGQASPSGNLDSTVVEMTRGGQPVAQWDVAGKADGVTADPGTHTVIATVNEDANSSLYAITPVPGGGVQHYAYNEPLPHDGGTDAISILNGQLYISASAPGTTGTLPAPQPTFPAVYTVTLDAVHSIATVTPLFFDEDPATVANVATPQSGHTVHLALTDPDSNEIVPPDGSRFAGEFMLTSQGDQQQIFVSPRGHTLSVLNLTQSVDDTAWPDDGHGALYATDSTDDTVVAVTGDFPGGPVVAATPCGADDAPATCPAPPSFPANYLALLNPWTGQVTALTVEGAPFVPQGGLLFIGGRDQQGHQ